MQFYCRPTVETLDHKPSNPPERERIQNAGGNVMIQRVNGSLAVSRYFLNIIFRCFVMGAPTPVILTKTIINICHW